MNLAILTSQQLFQRIDACKLVLGEDLLADLPVKAYGQKMAESPHMQKVLADRKENAALMASLTAKKT